MSDNFIFELPLQSTPKDDAKLYIRYDAGRHILNACLQESLKRLALARDSVFWKRGRSLPSGKQKTASYCTALKLYHFSEYELHLFVKKLMKNCWLGDHIDSQVAQKLASRAFQAVDKYRLGKKGKPRLKSRSQFTSLEGKSNITGIRFKNGNIHWKELVLKPLYNPSDEVEKHALHHKTKYVRLVRRRIKSKVRYSAQLILEGKPLMKEKHKVAKDRSVGLDIGPSTLAGVSAEEAFLIPLNTQAPKKQKKLQRALDRSRRETNPDNYKENGTPKKNCFWKKSTRYKQKETKLAEEKRKEAASRKTSHGHLANEILSMGATIKIEKISYSSFQKNYGKSVARHAPGQLIQTLRYKAENAGGKVIEFSCYHTKLSQTCHSCGKVQKKPLSQRWHHCSCGLEPMQRDLYSGFLALYVEDENLNRTQAQKAWSSAEPFLRQAVLRCNEAAKGKQRFACFGLS